MRRSEPTGAADPQTLGKPHSSGIKPLGGWGEAKWIKYFGAKPPIILLLTRRSEPTGAANLQTGKPMWATHPPTHFAHPFHGFHGATATHPMLTPAVGCAPDSDSAALRRQQFNDLRELLHELALALSEGVLDMAIDFLVLVVGDEEALALSLLSPFSPNSVCSYH